MSSGDNAEKFVVEKLTAASSVTDIIGTTGGKVSPMYRDLTLELPCIVYKTSNETAIDALDGYVGTSQYRVEVNCIASTYSQAKTLADAVRRALDEQPGTLDVTNVQRIRYDSSRDQYEKPKDGSGSGVHRSVLDFIIFSNRTSP